MERLLRTDVGKAVELPLRRALCPSASPNSPQGGLLAPTVLLHGPCGAGKSRFVRALLRRLVGGGGGLVEVVQPGVAAAQERCTPSVFGATGGELADRLATAFDTLGMQLNTYHNSRKLGSTIITPSCCNGHSVDTTRGGTNTISLPVNNIWIPLPRKEKPFELDLRSTKRL